jgi:hypothetical protein
MKKQAQRKNGSVAFFGAFVLALLGMGACANPLHEPAERSPDGSTGVRISIVTGGERTLLPTGAFSKYVLSFSTSDSVTVPEDVTLTDPNAVISLAPADWTIAVTAYVAVADTDVAAAEGSAQVSLNAGELKGALIRVSSKLDGANGYFSYNVWYPGDVTYGYLEIYDSSENQAAYSSQATTGDGISLKPGYYRLRVYLSTNYGMAARTEIVHIYPGMETRWEYAFNEVDFGNPIAISGTVDLSGMGNVYQATIILFRYSDFTYEEASFYGYNLSGDWSWAVKTLPFNQPTDLYVELRLQLSSGLLVKRLPVPITVYDGDLVAPDLGPFTVNQFNLSGVVDFRILTSLGITNIYDAQVVVYEDGDAPGQLGYASVNLEDGSWSLGLVSEEESLSARILSRTWLTYNSAIYDEIQTTLTGDESDLDFMPGVISAGTAYNGTGAGNEYSYLFAPDTSGDYFFTLGAAGSEYASLQLYNATGSSLNSAYGYPDAAFSQSLTAGDVYYITLYLNSPYRAFQFQVNPVTQALLGGTVDFTGLLSPFDPEATVSSADITIYADNSAHTVLGTGSIDAGDGSWSATVDLAGTSAPVLFVIAAELSNNQTIYHQESSAISGSNSSLNFFPNATTGGNAATRTTINQYDYLLYVPETTGDYSLRVSAGEDRYMNVELYNAQTGNYMYSTSGSGGLELIQTLAAGNPYHIRASSNPFETYQFQAEKLESITLSGIVELSGLAPLTASDVNYTEIRVYNGASSPVQLGSSVTAGDGSWSATIPASGSQTVRIEALVNLNMGRIIYTHIEDTVSGDTAGLDLAPMAATPVGGQAVPRASGYGWDSFLLVPSAGGFFNLGTISGMSNPNLYLYDAVTGAQLAQGSNGSLYAVLSAGTSYIVQIDNIGTFTAYQFQLSTLTSASIGGSVDYSNLPFSINSAISSATINGYLEPSHTQIVSGAPVAGGSWSALVPSSAVGQTVRLALTLNLNNGLAIYSHIQTVLTASASDLDFAPTAVPSGAAVNGQTAADGYDRFLFVPPTGDNFTLQAGSNTYTGITVYDGLTGSWIASSSSNPAAAIITSPSAGNPYIVQISCNGNSFIDYQFYAGPPATLGGTVNFSGLTSWTTDSAEALVFSRSNNDYNVLGTGTVSPGDAWSISDLPPFGEVVIALSALSTNGEGALKTQMVSVSGDNNAINFSPEDSDKNVATGAWHTRTTIGVAGEWLLWIPETTGEYVLDAENISMDPYMYLYDGLTGSQIAYDDDGGDGNNSSRIYCSVTAGHPYLIRVRAYSNGYGSFRFKAEEVTQ